MRINKGLIILLMCLALPMVGQAQSAHWAVSPIYQSVTRFASNLFKIKTAMSTGICDEEEKWVVSPSMDSITYLTNGYALAMTKNKDRYRIVYVVKENGTRASLKEEVYASEFPYFSDDRCAVVNKKGKYGFIDPSGKLVIPCSYNAAVPFQNGVAQVAKGKGKKKGDYIEINPSGSVVRTIDQLNKTDVGFVNKPYEAPDDPSYSRFMDNKEYGYKAGGTTILPAQFEEAEKPSDGHAIVMVDHMYGVVKFNTATIDCHVSESGGQLKVEAEIPSIWENKAATLTRIVNDASRKEYQMEGTGTERTLTTSVSKESGKRVYELACNKLVLWRSQYKVESSKGKGSQGGTGITVSAPASVKANKKGICAVPIKVVNRGSSERSISISLSTGQKSSLKVGAGKTGSVTVNVPVTKKTSCTITARGGGVSSSCSTTLNPAIVL